MKKFIVIAAGIFAAAGLTAGCGQSGSDNQAKITPKESPYIHQETVSFEKPVALTAGENRIAIDHPRYGYSAPCLADINGDGKKDLLVGQFTEGKIQVFLADQDGSFTSNQSRHPGFASGDYLVAGGEEVLFQEVW